MSETLHIVVPGPIGQLTGGYRFAARIVAGLRQGGRHVRVHELAGTFPAADRVARRAAAACVGSVGRGETAVIDGLALPAFAEVAPALAAKAVLIALVHHPLSLETGLSAASRDRFAALEPALLRHATGAIVTSPATARAVAGLGVPAARIAVVTPGLERPPNRARPRRGPCRLLCVATVTPRKGHDLALRALAGLRRRAWRLDCVGSLSRDPAWSARMRALVRSFGLGRRVRLAGEAKGRALARAYAGADVFVLPSWHEGYGMAFAEALAAGLPAVGAAAGAVPETVPRAAGRLVPPGNVGALRRALRPFIRSRGLRRRVGAQARRAGARLPGWPDAAAAFAAALDAMARA